MAHSYPGAAPHVELEQHANGGIGESVPSAGTLATHTEPFRWGALCLEREALSPD